METNSRWERHTIDGTCSYCGNMGKVKDEPFGNLPACQRCWEDICYGSE